MKLSNIRPLGRYTNSETGKTVNVKKGKRVERGTDIIFYLYRGTRVIIQDNDFYGGSWSKVSEFE